MDGVYADGSARGGGDLMWSGGFAGAGYDSVVLTVEGGSSIITQLRYHGEALRLRREYGADLVHLFTGESPWVLRGACGQHYLLARGDSAEDFSEYACGVHDHGHRHGRRYRGDLPQRAGEHLW